MTRPRWITATDAPDAFPPLNDALSEPDGLLAIGGDLSPQRLLAAYARGIFPWYESGQPILWWSPDPRAVLWPTDLHISRRLQRTRRLSSLRFSCDQAFSSVVGSCAAPRSYADSTWITPEMHDAYTELYQLGWAHSFEAWQDTELVAGMYGIAIGRVFFGESMFTRQTDASKLTFISAVEFLRNQGFGLVDCQIWSGHLQSLGASTIPRDQFETITAKLCDPPGEPGSWIRRFEIYLQSATNSDKLG